MKINIQFAPIIMETPQQVYRRVRCILLFNPFNVLGSLNYNVGVIISIIQFRNVKMCLVANNSPIHRCHNDYFKRE